MLSKDNKKFFIYTGILYLAVFLSYKIPHDSRSLAEIIIKPIRDGGSVFYPSSLVCLVIFIIGIYGFLQLERFSKRSKLLIFLLLIMLFLPFIKWSVDMGRTAYYSLVQNNLRSVDIEDSNITFNGVNDKLVITVNFTLVDYGNSQKQFKCRVYLPETLSKLTGIEIYEPQTVYITNGKHAKQAIIETFDVNLKEGVSFDQLVSSNFNYEDATYELYNDKETVKIIDYGYSINH